MNRFLAVMIWLTGYVLVASSAGVVAAAGVALMQVVVKELDDSNRKEKNDAA